MAVNEPSTDLSSLNLLGWAQITGNDGALYHSWVEVYASTPGTFLPLPAGRLGTTTINPLYSPGGALLSAGTIVPFKRAYYDPVFDWVYAIIAVSANAGASPPDDAIWLNSSTQFLQVVLSEAATTQLPWTIDFTTYNASYLPIADGNARGSTNSSTSVSMLQGIASSAGIVGVKHVSVNNVDNVQHTVTVQVLDGPTNPIPLVQAVLAVNSSLHFDYKTGEWYTLPTSALPANQGPTGPAGAPGTPGATVIGLDGEPGFDGMPIPGPIGPVGPIGPTSVGIPGWDGDEGPEGMPIPGPVGAVGPMGPPGLIFPGLDGNEGEMGLVVPGPPGITVPNTINAIITAGPTVCTALEATLLSGTGTGGSSLVTGISATDIVKIEPGMVFNPHTGFPGTGVVTSVNQSAGTITVNELATTGGSFGFVFDVIPICYSWAEVTYDPTTASPSILVGGRAGTETTSPAFAENFTTTQIGTYVLLRPRDTASGLPTWTFRTIKVLAGTGIAVGQVNGDTFAVSVDPTAPLTTPSITFPNSGSPPATPPAGDIIVYQIGGDLFQKNSSGSVVPVGGNQLFTRNYATIAGGAVLAYTIADPLGLHGSIGVLNTNGGGGNNIQVSFTFIDAFGLGTHTSATQLLGPGAQSSEFYGFDNFLDAGNFTFGPIVQVNVFLHDQLGAAGSTIQLKISLTGLSGTVTP